MPIQEHPEFDPLQFPDDAAEQCPALVCSKGSAVFFETWMAGGLGRGQGAYDEMVFRAKVRDNDKFYSPLGLESEGIAVDFQVGVNDYLYGTRFFSYLALTYGPGQSHRTGCAATRAARHSTRPSSSTCSASRSTMSWNDWIAFEREFQQENLAKLSAYPLTEVTASEPARALAPSRAASSTSKTNSLVAAFRYPGPDRLHRDDGPCHRQASPRCQNSRA